MSNILDEIKRLRELTENAEFIAASRTAIPALCDALEKAIETLEYYSHPDHYEPSATLGGTGFRKPGASIEKGDMARALLKEWGIE